MQLYDTRTQSFQTSHFAKTVRMYVCGITPYDSAHLGHAFVYTQFDVLNRHLQALGHTVQYCRNVTDLDDDTLRTARKRGVHFQMLARSESAGFEANLTRLGLLKPTFSPFVTDNVPATIPFIQGLLDQDLAYVLQEGRVYMDSSHPNFLAFSKLSPEQALEFFTERGGDPDFPGKRNKMDFLLWQPSLADEPAWDTPWGAGRPGWHIECSVMLNENLGNTIDIHGGGSDLIFPHHEASILQAEALTGHAPLATFWMHTGMVALEGVKMSKSLGNLVFLNDLLDKHSPDAIRYLLLSNHYRCDWTYSEDKLAHALQQVAKWRDPNTLTVEHQPNLTGDPSIDEAIQARRPGTLTPMPSRYACTQVSDGAIALDQEISALLDKDLDTPAALALLDAAAARGEYEAVAFAGRHLGFFQNPL